MTNAFDMGIHTAEEVEQAVVSAEQAANEVARQQQNPEAFFAVAGRKAFYQGIDVLTFLGY